MRKRHLYENPNSPAIKLAQLKAFTEFVQAQRQDPRLTIASHARGRNVDSNTWWRHLTALELEVGCDLVRREVDTRIQRSESVISTTDGDWHTKRKRAVPTAPEHTDEEANASVVRTSEVTLDGEIWAEYGALALKLYELARHATDMRPPPAKHTMITSTRPNVLSPPPDAQTMENSGGSMTAKRIIPHSTPDVARRSFLEWLKSQNAAIERAKEMAINRRAPVYDLVGMSLLDDDFRPLDFKWGERAPYDYDQVESAPDDDDSR